jgi:hypothetical protein
MDLVQLPPALADVPSDRPRDRGHEHVVDRGLVAPAGASDAPQVDRSRPRDEVRTMQLALDGRIRVRPRQQQLAEGLRILDRSRGQGGGGAPGVESDVRARPRDDLARSDCRQRKPERIEAAGAPGRVVDRRVARLAVVGQQHHHARERDAVRDAVVDAHEHRASLGELVDEVDVPERSIAIERAGDAIRDECLQRALVVRRRQGDVMEVQGGVEVRIVLPPRPAERAAFDRALAEAVEPPYDALEEPLAQSLPRDRLVEPEHRVDDHRVRRAVHVEPCRVRGLHRSLRRHDLTLVADGRPRHPPVSAQSAGKVRPESGSYPG